jgi:hypothetical protein
MLDNSTTANKTFIDNKQQSADSITQVDFRLDGPRQTCTFKGNRKLWKAFVPFCKANYGSVCHVLEPVEIALMEGKVNLSNTIKPLHIENLNVERVVKRVRRYEVEEVEEFREAAKVGVCVVCGKTASVKGIDREGVRFLCRTDFLKVKNSLVGWKVLE